MLTRPGRPATLYRLRSPALAWGAIWAGLLLAVRLLLGGPTALDDSADLTWWCLGAACLWGGWSFYSSVTVTATEVVVRPATSRKVRVRVPRAQVAVAGRYVADGRPVAWYSLPPGTLHFSCEFTDEDGEGNPTNEAIVIRYQDEQLATFLSPTHWFDLQAALLALGPAQP